jgi:hypothetical protein
MSETTLFFIAFACRRVRSIRVCVCVSTISSPCRAFARPRGCEIRVTPRSKTRFKAFRLQACCSLSVSLSAWRARDVSAMPLQRGAVCFLVVCRCDEKKLVCCEECLFDLCSTAFTMAAQRESLLLFKRFCNANSPLSFSFALQILAPTGHTQH